jgi:hypothetical protein
MLIYRLAAPPREDDFPVVQKTKGTKKMKTSSLALAAVLLAGAFSVSAPAFAYEEGDGPVFDTDGYTRQLEAKGLDVRDVESYGADAIVATVRDSDGHQSFMYFDKDSLRPLNSVDDGHANRVLSKLDVAR